MAASPAYLIIPLLEGFAVLPVSERRARHLLSVTDGPKARAEMAEQQALGRRSTEQGIRREAGRLAYFENIDEQTKAQLPERVRRAWVEGATFHNPMGLASREDVAALKDLPRSYPGEDSVVERTTGNFLRFYPKSLEVPDSSNFNTGPDGSTHLISIETLRYALLLSTTDERKLKEEFDRLLPERPFLALKALTMGFAPEWASDSERRGVPISREHLAPVLEEDRMLMHSPTPLAIVAAIQYTAEEEEVAPLMGRLAERFPYEALELASELSRTGRVSSGGGALYSWQNEHQNPYLRRGLDLRQLYAALLQSPNSETRLHAMRQMAQEQANVPKESSEPQQGRALIR